MPSKGHYGFKAAELRQRRSEPIPEGQLGPHVFAAKNRRVFFGCIVRRPEGNVVSPSLVQREAKLLNSLVDRGLLEVMDTPDGRVRLKLTEAGRQHEEMRAVAAGLERVRKARVRRPATPAPPMPLEDAVQSIRKEHALCLAIGDLLRQAEKPGAVRLIPFTHYMRCGRPLQSLAAAGLIRIQPDPADKKQVMLSLTEKGKRDGYISGLGV